MAKDQFLRFPIVVKRDPAIEIWMLEHSGYWGAIARRWLEVLRGCGDDVRELLHDGHPTACVDDVQTRHYTEKWLKDSAAEKHD